MRLSGNRVVSKASGDELDDWASRLEFTTPDDPFYLAANSSLLNSAQLSSLYSSTGTRVHLILALSPMLGAGDRSNVFVHSDTVVMTQLNHLRSENSKHSPYELAGSVVSLKPGFVSFVFDDFHM